MAEKITYYAIVDDHSSREQPAGVLRRIVHDGGQRDEAFGRNLAWGHTSLLYSAERGNLDNRFYEITEDEAMRIVARIREEASRETRADGLQRRAVPQPVVSVIVDRKVRKAAPFDPV